MSSIPSRATVSRSRSATGMPSGSSLRSAHCLRLAWPRGAGRWCDASLPDRASLLLLTLYFTYSRGGWIALFAGLAVAIAIDRRRLQLITTVLVLAPWPALAIWAASRSPSLTHAGAALTAASRDGHGLAVITMALVVAAALAILVVDWLEAALSIPHGLRRLYAGTLIFILAASLIVVFGRYGFPPTLARKAYDAFSSSAPDRGANLNSRLFSLSGNGRTEQFHTAWQQVGDHPVLGGGAGSYDQYWFEHRRVSATVHDAHNLYLETLAELGPLGLVLLALVLGAPLAAVATSTFVSPDRGRLRRVRRLSRPRVHRLGLGDAGRHAVGAGLRACPAGSRAPRRRAPGASSPGSNDGARARRRLSSGSSCSACSETAPSRPARNRPTRGILPARSRRRDAP